MIAAMMWAVAFWHEEGSVALEVIGMINDILWLHREYHTADGVYTEGVIMYSVMSIEGLVRTAVVQRASFGAAPAVAPSGSLNDAVRGAPARRSARWKKKEKKGKKVKKGREGWRDRHEGREGQEGQEGQEA